MTPWSLACPDWEDRIRTGRVLVPELPLWKDRARKAVAVFNRLRVADIPGTPTFGEAAGDWFRAIVEALHGSLDPATRERMIRELFLLVPKKNSKTTGGAGLMLASLLVNDRPRAEFLLVAPTQEIAKLAFGQIEGAIDLDPWLQQRCHVQTHLKKVTFLPTGATLQIKSFDPKVMTGVKPAGVLIDELHVIAESADADRVMGQIRGGLLSQPEGFMVIITTQSERPPKGVFRAELNKARAIRDGRTEGRMLPVLYEFPDAIQRTATVPGEPAPWENPALWHMVTPNNGRSIKVERLVEDYETAKLAGEEELRRWATQHLNIEIGLALRSDRWAGADWWESRSDPDLTLEVLCLRSDVVCAGIDGGGLDDLLGFAVIGRDRVTREWLHWGRAWAHSSVLERRKAEAARFRDFERDGDLVIVQELGRDIAEVADLVAELDASGLLAKVGLDPVGIGAIVDALAEKGIEGDRLVGIPQGWKLAGAIKTMERKLADGTMSHAGQPLMAWCVGNAKVEPRGNAIAITKQAAGSAKIDPLMAAFDAAALMATNPEPVQRQSAYNERGLLILG